MTAVQGQQGELVGHSFQDVRRSVAGSEVQPSSKEATPLNYTSLNAIEAALITAGYSQSRLNVMNLNDKIYALRLANDSAGIK